MPSLLSSHRLHASVTQRPVKWPRVLDRLRSMRLQPSGDCFLPTAYCLLLSACCLLLFSTGCGYHVAGKGDRLPPDVKTIAVPIFVNQSPRFRIEQMVSEAVTREFIERTSYRITPNPQEADAVLRGTVKDVRAGVVTFDPTTGRASTMQIQVTADVKLVDSRTHKILYSNSNYIFREQYQISPSESGLFEEDQPALRRLSQDLARTLVTAILENF
jgi:outer membrane lipopolysaccharide assembly protein LptE/RlpB